MSTKDHDSTLSALTFIRERLDNIDGKIDKMQEKLERFAIDHAGCLSRCDVSVKEIEILKTQAEHSKKFRTQVRAILWAFGIAWSAVLGFLEYWKHKP